MRLFCKIILVVLVLLFLRLSLYTVDAAEYAYVTVLGRHVATFDGAGDGGGLHLGWPWPAQSVQRLDRRLQYFDLPQRENLTYDPKGKTIDKTLTVDAFVLWRIADGEGVDRFIKKLGTAEQAKAILGQRINSRLAAAITQMRMDDLVSIEPGTKQGETRVDEKIGELQKRLLDDLRGPVQSDYGIELVDIGLRRFNHPEKVRESIFKRIRSEREIKVAEIQSQGELEAKNIESAADEKKSELLAKARFEEEKLKSQADTQATLIRNQAHLEDPAFYAFLKQMEKLQSILGDNKTVLLLSTHRQLFDLLFQPPRPGLTVPGSEDKKGPATPGGKP